MVLVELLITWEDVGLIVAQENLQQPLRVVACQLLQKALDETLDKVYCATSPLITSCEQKLLRTLKESHLIVVPVFITLSPLP